MQQNIVLIDDNFAIRQIIKVFLARLSRKYTFDLKIFSSDNGVEGLGFVFITDPNIIIVDTTLPKYSGKNIVEFFVQNRKFRSKEITVIVLEERTDRTLNLPKNFIRINKNHPKAFDKLTDVLVEKLNISDFGRMSKFYDYIGGKVMNFSNKDDLLEKKLEGKFKLSNILYRFKWAIQEIFISTSLSLIMLFFGKAKDDNIAQLRVDRKTFRTKYYPTLALSFVSALFILINISLFAFSQFSIFTNYQLDTKALTTFVVDSSADDADFSIGDGFCDTNDSVGDGPCTLRAAIEEANVTIDDVTISFNIPGAGVHTLIPASVYPTITRSIVIDGTTQTGTDCSTSTLMVELNGTNIVGGADGLKVNTTSSSNIVVKGLVIQNYNGSGISLEGAVAGTASISCNIIGLDSDGVTINDNETGIWINSYFNATIGGLTENDRNIISGNTYAGILTINNGQANVYGNYIGTDSSGLLLKGNDFQGVYLLNNSILGGNTESHRNIIAGSETGVVIGLNSTARNNYIGIGSDGITSLGNIVGLEAGSDSFIESNVIGFNDIGIKIFGGYTDDLGTINIDSNFIGLDYLGENPAPNSTGIEITSGIKGEGFWGSATVNINNNTISSNSIGVSSTNAAQEGNAIYINMNNNRIGTSADQLIDRGNEYRGVYATGGGTFTNNIVAFNGHVQIGDAAIILSYSEDDITDNHFISNINGGLELGSSTGIKIQNNTFTDNPFSMQLNQLETSEITTNTFCNSTGGEVILNYSNDNLITNNKFGSTNDTSLEIKGTSIGNAIIENDFSISTEIPIDLDDDGATANDPGDIDTGPNNLQNYPSDIALVGEDITFNLDTNAANYRIEFHVPDSGSCSEISSLMCSGGIDHAGGTVSYSLNCPGLPLGDFDIYGLAILEPTPFEYSDTSELSPLTTLNNLGPTNTPTPTETPVPTATNTPVPTATNTPVPTATNTPVPTATNTPIPTATNTPIPTATNTPVPTPTSTSMPTPISAPVFVPTFTPTAGAIIPSPTTEIVSDTVMPSEILMTQTPTSTPVIQLDSPTPTVLVSESNDEGFFSDFSPKNTYAMPEESVVNHPVVKSVAKSITQRLEQLASESSSLLPIVETPLIVAEAIKPITDNFNYYLSLRFIGENTALAGISTTNVLAYMAPAIVTAASQPRILFHALTWFWKRKSKQPWGIVFDKNTGTPVAFARMILTQDGKTISTQTTDLQGKYGFSANKGKYQVYISHSDYLDFVSDIEVGYDGEIISKDFEVSAKTRDDVNSGLRWTFYRLKKQISNNLFILNTTIFSIGFVYTLFAITNHLTLLNYVILSLYLFQFVLMFVFYLFKDKESGQVTDIASGLPVPGAIVRVFDDERQIDIAITDSQGRYSFILEPGNYFIKASANGYVFPSDDTPNIVKDKLGGKLLKFTIQDKQRVNIKIYMRKFASLNANNQAILSPFS